MILNVFLLELRLLTRDRTAWVLLALFALSLGYGIANGKRVAERVHAAGEAGVTAVEKQHDLVRNYLRRQAQGGGGAAQIGAHAIALRGSSAVLPPAPLSVLAVGQSDLSPAHEVVSIFGSGKPAENRAELENPSHLLAGPFDLAFVLIWLFPLFLLGLVHDLMAGDRENGTLRLALSQGISPLGWMLRRAVARALPLLVLAVAAVLIAWTSRDASVPMSRVGLAVAVVLAYAVFWIALAMAVNTFAASAASSATVLGSCWVLFVLVAPTLLNVAVESAYPTPSRAELVALGREAGKEAEKKGNEVINSFYKEHPELAPPGQRASYFSRSLAIDLEVRDAVDPRIAKFDEQLDAQQSSVSRWRFVSPAIAAHEALTDLAGTGFWRYRAFREQVGEFRGEVAQFFSPRIHRGENMTIVDYPSIPTFEFEEPTDGAWVGRAGVGIGGILGLALLFALWAVWNLRPARLGRLSV